MEKVFVDPIRRIWSFRRILANTAIQEIKKKYAGSFLGISWVIIYPILFLAVYSVIYGFVFSVSYPGMTMVEYICLIFSGLLIFLGFNESVVAGTQSVVANAGLIKNTMYPIELVPVRAVLCGQTTQGAGLVMLVIALFVIGKASPLMPMILLVWLLELLMEMGISWILSSLNVVIRDTQSIIGILMLMLMMASPIAYPVSMVPERLKPFVMMNPIFCFVVTSQHIMIQGKLPESDILVGMIMWSIVPFILGYQFFVRMKGVFVDNV